MLIVGVLSCKGDDRPTAPRPVPVQGTWTEMTDVPAVQRLEDIWGSPDGAVVAVGNGGVALRRAGGRWSRIPLDTYESLTDVWGSSADDYYAIGYFGLYHFDGDVWSAVDAGGYGVYRAVWGRSASEVYAVGPKGVVKYFDGTGWSDKPIADSVVVDDIWGTGPGNLYATSYSGDLFLYDGLAWENIPLDYPAGTGVARLIDGASATNILITGSVSFQFDGSQWHPVDHPTTDHGGVVWLDDLHASGEDNYYAVSSEALYHFDGSTWTELWRTPSVNPRTQLRGVWRGASDPVLVVGSLGDIWQYQDGGATMLNLTTFTISDMWGSSTDNAYAVGEFGTVLRYDGSSWARGDTISRTAVTSIWGRGEDDVYAVDGSNIYHSNGQDWTTFYSCSHCQFGDIWGFPEGQLVAVGRHGILSFDGATWSEFPVSAGLEAVWGSGPGDVYAVGQDNVLHFNGRNWEMVLLEFDGNWNDVWGWSVEDILIGGSGGVLRFDGRDWRWWNEAGPASVSRIWGPPSSKDVFLVSSQRIRRFDGRDWTTMNLSDEIGSYVGARAIWGSSATDFFVGGSYGLILHYGTDE
jgi:hypothetical protein